MSDMIREERIRLEYQEQAAKMKEQHDSETDALLRIIEEKDRTIAKLRREADALTLVIRKVCNGRH